MVEYWPSIHEALGSIPTALKGKSIKCLNDLFRVRHSGAVSNLSVCESDRGAGSSRSAWTS